MMQESTIISILEMGNLMQRIFIFFCLWLHNNSMAKTEIEHRSPDSWTSGVTTKKVLPFYFMFTSSGMPQVRSCLHFVIF